jgi:hypothetical protein
MSWVRPNRKNPKAKRLLLKHEQGHFDITELYARKLKKAILDASIRCENIAQANDQDEVSRATRIIDQLKMDYTAAHERYDTDTNGGTDPIAQAAASNSIANELASLDLYKSEGILLSALRVSREQLLQHLQSLESAVLEK